MKQKTVAIEAEKPRPLTTADLHLIASSIAEQVSLKIECKNKEPYLTLSDVATILGISESQVSVWMYERGLPYLKPTQKTLRFRRADVDQFMAETFQAR